MQYKHKPRSKPLYPQNQAKPAEDKFKLLPIQPNSKSIAIIQPASFGDNINSTLMLKPLRQKFPTATIDVYTSTAFASAFYNNPLISNVIPSVASTKKTAIHLLQTLPNSLPRAYDIVCTPHPMINPTNWSSKLHPELGENLICAWLRALELNDIPYELPLETHLYLTAAEVAKTNRFITIVSGFSKPKNLLEVEGLSGQSFWTPKWTTAVTELLCSYGELVFISSRKRTNDILKLQMTYPRQVYHVGALSLRECAELFNHCQRFFSCSSGLSNVCNTNWCKKDINWIETINSPVVSSAPLRATNKLFWYENDLPKFLNAIQRLS